MNGPEVNRSQAPPLARLRGAFPWPGERPEVPARREHGWLREGVKAILRGLVRPDMAVIVELGAWLGLSTRFLADLAPRAAIVSVDHWCGSAEHHAIPECRELLPALYETFLVNCWEYREQVLPLRMSIHEGLAQLAAFGVQPDLIYLDGDHSYEAVRADLALILELFPFATLVGDDWDWEGVRRAVSECAAERGRAVSSNAVGWHLLRADQSRTMPRG